MNKYAILLKVLKVIKSCQNEEQYNITVKWYYKVARIHGINAFSVLDEALWEFNSTIKQKFEEIQTTV